MRNPLAQATIAPNLPIDTARYSRQLALPGFGLEAQLRLHDARVLVVGAGGLGSATIPVLAAAGFGTVGIIDSDLVELSNLHRQTIHATADVGRGKVESAAETVAALNPAVSVIAHDAMLSSKNALRILRDFDLVIDGSDNFPTRYLVSDAASILGIPVVWGAVLRYGGQAGVSGLVAGSHSSRWSSTAEGRLDGPTYRDLFPSPPEPGSVPSCAEAGVLSTVCVVIGGILSSEAIKIVTGVGSPLIGRVTVYDALQGTFRELNYERDPHTKPIRKLIDYKAFCGVDHSKKEIRSVGARALAHELHRPATTVQLIDVREPWEAELASIDDSSIIPLDSLPEELAAISQTKPVVVYCHHGARSQHAAELLISHGFTDVRWLDGGIDGWAIDVDPTMARY